MTLDFIDDYIQEEMQSEINAMSASSEEFSLQQQGHQAVSPTRTNTHTCYRIPSRSRCCCVCVRVCDDQ